LPASALPDADFATVANVVRAAFGQRRKTLSNALSSVMDASAIAAAGIDPRARAEQLTPAEFVALANFLSR
jgi:16S rRNA (adenine1518-N6/adenine1519-N6)-dimethyltransferase